jgi:hypothetical protein
MSAGSFGTDAELVIVNRTAIPHAVFAADGRGFHQIPGKVGAGVRLYPCEGRWMADPVEDFPVN